jgi:hypothetical protein
VGGRFEWGAWGFSFATGKGKLAWSTAVPTADEAGATLDMDLMMGRISRSLGAIAFVDLGGPDIRLGLALPEIYLRVSYATLGAGAQVSGPGGGSGSLPSDATYVGLQLGLSIIGARFTAGDTFYLELLLGEVHGQAAGWQLAEYTSGGTTNDQVQIVQTGWGADFLPTVRAGLAF